MARNSLFTDLTGKKFGRWTVIDLVTTRPHSTYWNCICDCGTKREVRGSNLRRGIAQSCGCLIKEKMTKHGMTYQREWKSWTGLKSRCYTKTDHHYRYYGGRGIRVCERWRESFLNFFEDMGTCPKGFTIERINNDGNYEPSNCRWASKRDQCRNRRNNVRLTLNGETHILSDWASIRGIPKRTLEYRHHKGLSDAQILSKSKVIVCKQSRRFKDEAN